MPRRKTTTKKTHRPDYDIRRARYLKRKADYANATAHYWCPVCGAAPGVRCVELAAFIRTQPVIKRRSSIPHAPRLRDKRRRKPTTFSQPVFAELAKHPYLVQTETP